LLGEFVSSSNSRGERIVAKTPTIESDMSAEQSRLKEAREKEIPWRQWGPYLSERQWGTVREDYSENGDAWNYFSHDQARSRAYHWGEDGIAGLSDDKQRLCFALALWNGKDPILKERLFGLTNSEGNHGEDVKECYFYLDSTPTHSYMKYLYKYPQDQYPYVDLIETTRRRCRSDPEYELIDTGIFNGDRYFDVFVEYAKAAPTDILIQVSICNRGPDQGLIHVLPTLWFRNFWTWWPEEPKPSLSNVSGKTGARAISATEAWLGDYFLRCDGEEAETGQARNREWFHMISGHVIFMPDKWEYPWFAAWDLAFHTVALSTVDIDFAKEQLELLLVGAYQHPTGQVPAYEWNFSDVNPPVQAWGAIFLFRKEYLLRGKRDLLFLRRIFGKLMWNFGWWANRKDRDGRNLYEGGFLGLDNIGVFDRSAPLPTGGHLEQADGTAWMALYSQNMLEIAVRLSEHDPAYEDLAADFAVHFVLIARAMNEIGPDGMWDEEDGFYYDVLRRPDGSTARLKVRSMVGLLPLCAVVIIEKWQRERISKATDHLFQRLQRMPELAGSIHATGPGHHGYAERGILALVNEGRLRRVLSRMLDENEFLSPHGIRSLSRYHADHPYIISERGQEYQVNYLPAESDNAMFGGNSNWRGPVWMPVNALLIRALEQYYLYYGDSFRIECPTGSGNWMNLFEVAREIASRLPDFPARPSRPTPGVWWSREISKRPRLAQLFVVLRVLSRRQRSRHRRQSSDRLDWDGGPADRIVRALRRQDFFRTWAGCRA
jgi:hypothetical protein